MGRSPLPATALSPWRRSWRLLLSPRGLTVLLLLALGCWVVLADPVDREQLQLWGEWLSARPWALLLLLLIQVALFALALPGSLVLWLVAPVLPWLPAVLLLLLGSVLGSVAAWLVARWLGASARSRVAGHPVFKLLSDASDPLTQTALRVLPGFPHSMVNYAAGVLALPLPSFILAACIGLGLKWMLYVSAIQGLLEAGEEGGAPGLIALLPLLLLALFLLGGRWLAARWRARRAAMVKE